MKDKQLLRSQAYQLYKLGLTVERKRKKLKSLEEQGFAYNSGEMLYASEQLSQVAAKWQRLESEHLKLKEKIDKAKTL